MRFDRLIQLVAMIAALACIAVAGAMLPSIVEGASEPKLVVRVGEGASAAKKLIPISDLRKMTTVAPGSGSEFAITFANGSETWKGPLGSTVAVDALEAGNAVNVQGFLEGTEGYGLRYTDVAIDGAPPIVAIGTVLGAVRGLIVDYLWIKVNMMKEKGLFYEVMEDADLITKLQPRFGEVWGFHGHNMAYNISVLTNTTQERWEWVNQGIDLVRNRGLRYNPNDIVLHKDLAFWFAHKIDGVADDAHLYYKRMLAREWHIILGEPPYDYDERVAWIKRIADAPDTLPELERDHPEVTELLKRLETDLKALDKRAELKLDKGLLVAYGSWAAVKSSSYAKMMDLEHHLLATEGDEGASSRNRFFQLFERTFNDPSLKEAGDELIAFLRKKVLSEAYNMDARLMYQFTRDTGPLDWRHPQAHALYWARKGSLNASVRYVVSDNDVSRVINDDRIEIQAMQALTKSGLMRVDPLSDDNPSRIDDARWIKPTARHFRELYAKFYHVHGAAADTFANGYENYMKHCVRLLYREGDRAGAQELVDDLDAKFGTGGLVPNMQYKKPLDVLVQEFTVDEYEFQPDVARDDVYAALRRGFREGLLYDHQDVLQDALRFASEVTTFFKENHYNDFVNKFGEGRMKDLIGTLETSVRDQLGFVVLDTSQPLYERLYIYRNAPEKERREIFDQVKPQLVSEIKGSQLARLKIEDLVPEPPGMDEYRAQLAAEVEAQKNRDKNRGEAERK